MSSLRFHERMAGFVTLDEPDYNAAFLAGRRAGTALTFGLDIRVADVDRFVEDPEHTAPASGEVRCDLLGGTCAIHDGVFNLFVTVDAGRRLTEMRYRLPMTTPDGRELTLVGVKRMQDGPGADVWSDTTTLFTRLLDGEREIGRGILRISPVGFVRLLTTMRADRPDALGRFGGLFLGRLWETYGGKARMDGDPAFPGVDPFRGHPPGTWVDEPDGRAGLTRRIVPFTARDGGEGTLHQFRSLDRDPDKGPVLCIHGVGVRGDLFLGPAGPGSWVKHLADAGYEVWLENWRGSIDFLPTEFTLDTAAAYDHPAAIETVLAESGHDTLKVVLQCQGSTSFTITALAGLAPQVTHVVSNAVSLHPVVPRLSHLKVSALVPVLGEVTPVVDAQWGIRKPSPLAIGMSRWASLLRRECDDPVCAMANYMYGVGPDVLWVHDQLDDATHHWVSREFSWASLRFLKQMRASVRAGHLVPYDHLEELPESYVRTPPRIDAKWTFVGGTKNRLYLPVSQDHTHAFFERHDPGRHARHAFAGYGHLDPLFGKNAPAETFPVLMAGLEG